MSSQPIFAGEVIVKLVSFHLGHLKKAVLLKSLIKTQYNIGSSEKSLMH